MLSSRVCVVDITSEDWRRNPAQVLCNLSKRLAEGPEFCLEAIVVSLDKKRYAIKIKNDGKSTLTLATMTAVEVLRWPQQQNGRPRSMIPYKNLHLALGGNTRGRIVLNSDYEDITEPFKRTGDMEARATDSLGKKWGLTLQAG